MQFNKILQPVYSAVTGFSMGQDGSLSVTYMIGTGTETEGQITDFTPLVSDYKHLSQEQAQQILMTPLKKEDIGKPFQDLMLDRIYHYLLDNGFIKV